MDIPPNCPRRGNCLTRWIGRFILYLLGWRVDTTKLTNVPKIVLLGGPHTSNWEFIMTLLITFSTSLDIHFMGKHTMFKFPFGPLVRFLGGIAVDRRHKHDLVAATVHEFDSRDRFCIGIMPEGTRDRVDNWKTGFWYIAKGANVPICPVLYDYGRKVLEFGDVYYPTDDIEEDMWHLQYAYKDAVGKNPELQLKLPVADAPPSARKHSATSAAGTEASARIEETLHHRTAGAGVKSNL